MRFCSSCGSRFSNDARYCPVDGQPTVELPEEQPKADPLLGTLVDGRYQIERALGEGGMGVVYLATHMALQKRFALKVLRGDMARDQDVVQRFVQEAQASSAIGHPNIVDISDFGRLADGSSYFVMEFLDGTSLTDAIAASGGMSVDRVVSIVEMIASALAAAHDRGIIHRDLKPDNVFLIRRGGNEDFVKVLDFGIAKVGGAASKLTRTGMIFGTPHYMSPEQAAGQAVDKRTDIYALGVITYEMLTGKVPFDADTFMGILSKHMFEAPRPPVELLAKSGGALDAVVLKALVKKPEQRYQSMEEVLRDLATIRSGGKIAAPASSVPPPPNLAAAIPDAPSSSTQPSLSPATRKRYIALGMLGLLGVGALFGVAIYATNRLSAPAVTSEMPPMPIPVLLPQIGVATTPRSATIRIESDPSGATVYAGEAIVGTTPVDVPRPTSGSTRLELRLEGHHDAPLVILDVSDSPTFVPMDRIGAPPRVVDPSPARTSTLPRSPSRSSTPRPASEPAPAPARPPRPFTTDVVDPWD